MTTVEIDGHVTGDVLHLTWRDARSSGECRFDRLADTQPEWLGDADELLDGAGRRQVPSVLAAVAAWAKAEGYELGIWTDGEGVEVLGEP